MNNLLSDNSEIKLVLDKLKNEGWVFFDKRIISKEKILYEFYSSQFSLGIKYHCIINKSYITYHSIIRDGKWFGISQEICNCSIKNFFCYGSVVLLGEALL